MESPSSDSAKTKKKSNSSFVVGIGGLQRPGPSEILYKGYRLLITDRPTDATLPFYVEELKKRHVTDVVRVCEPTYRTELLEKEHIKVHEMQFDDGSSPVPEIVDDWLHLIRDRFRENSEACVAVHCVAGLGRAPVLVALALVELGMKFEDAVEHIRSLRRGAINARQLSYLEKYRAKNRLKQRRGSESNAQSNWLSTVAKKILKK